ALEAAVASAAGAVAAKGAEVAAERSLIAASHARIAQAHAEHTLLSHFGTPLGLVRELAEPAAPPEPPGPAGTVRVKASAHVVAAAADLERQNQRFEAAIREERDRRRRAREASPSADDAVFGPSPASRWLDVADAAALAEAPPEWAGALAWSRQVAELSAQVAALPSGSEAPADLSRMIGQLKGAAEPAERLLAEVRRRLERVAEVAQLRQRLREALADARERARRLSAYEFHQRAEVLQRLADELPGDADWDSRRGLEQGLEALERDLARREAEVAAFEARVVALGAVYEAFQSQGLELSTKELELWTPEGGRLRRRGANDEVLVRVPGSRKAARVRVANSPENPGAVAFAVDQVWLGARDGEDGGPPPTAQAGHAEVCAAMAAALELLPGYGIALGEVHLEEGPEDSHLPVIALEAELEEILAEERAGANAAVATTKQGGLTRSAPLPDDR
ncbi:MAG: hypothetical protein LBO20_07330, partial [Bifidobacteriaceae bacterium]|nr:hypothetical protein [Bifidobacteriaceae bacterium]